MLESHNQINRWGSFDDGETGRIQNQLADKIPPDGISYRSSAGMGGQVAYLEGWRAFNYANEIFGFNGWSSEILNFTTDFIDVENGRISVGISCTVRIILKDGTFHDDIGYGVAENVKSKGAALDKARKEAVTDATKRALRLFGNHLGNCCYDKDYLKEIKSGSYNRNQQTRPPANVNPMPGPPRVPPSVPQPKPDIIMTEEDVLMTTNDFSDIPMQPMEPTRPFAPFTTASIPQRPVASPVRATTFQPGHWQPAPMPLQAEFKPFNPPQVKSTASTVTPTNEFVKWNPAGINSHFMKVFLKQAREAINAKDYEKALNIIDTGLADDELLEPENRQNHYMLLVFRGVSLDKLGRQSEAVESYEKATMLDQTSTLAWQGLVNLHEEANFELSKRIRPLESLTALYKKSDKIKHYETLSKLIEVYENANMHSKAKDQYYWLLSPEASTYYGTNVQIDHLKMLKSFIICCENFEEDQINQEVQKRRFRLGAGPVSQIRAAVESEIVKSSDLEDWYKKLIAAADENDLKQTFKLKLAKRLAAKTTHIADIESKKNNWALLLETEKEVFDEQLFELVVDNLDNPHFESLKGHFEEYSKNCPAGRLHSEVQYYLGITQEFGLQKDSLFSCLLRSKLSWEKGLYEEFINVLSFLREAIDMSRKKFAGDFGEILKEINYRQFLAWVYTERFGDAIKIVDDFDENDKLVFDAKLLIFRNLNMTSEIIELLSLAITRNPNNAQLHSDLGWEYFLSRNYLQSESNLENALKLQPENPEILYRIGQVYWQDQSKHQEALAHWLLAIKSDPNHALTFLSLGKFYSMYEDNLRAEKCFQRALKLNGLLIESAVNLAQIWARKAWKSPAKQYETGRDIISLLEPFSTDNLRNWYLWMYLGIGFSWFKKDSKATVCFQNSLKSEGVNELECLILLADSYRKEKKMTAALKAYERSLEVNSDLLIAKIGMAMVLMEIGQFEKSLGTLESIDLPMNEIGRGIDSLKAKCHVLFASKLVGESEFVAALNHMSEAIEKYKSLAIEGFLTPSSYRSLARLCKLIEVFTNHEIYGKICQELEYLVCHLKIKDRHFEILSLVKSAPLKLAIMCLILCMESESYSANNFLLAEIWLEIGQNLLFEGYKHDLSPRILQTVESCSQKSLYYHKNLPEAWNLHGLISMEQGRYPLAQHCFIKALETSSIEMSHVWINLALLYLKLGDVELVQQALGKAQMADVENPLVWYTNAQLIGFQSPKAIELLSEAVNCPASSTLMELNRAFSCLAFRKYRDVGYDEEKQELLNDLELSLKRLHVLDKRIEYFDNIYGLVLEINQSNDYLKINEIFANILSNAQHKSSVMNNYFRTLIRSNQYSDASKQQLSINTKFLEIFEAMLQANIQSSSRILESKIDAELLAADRDLWDFALWQAFKLQIRFSQINCDFFNQSLEQAESLPALIAKMLLCQDDNDICEACLLQALELATNSTTIINPEFIWILCSYMISKNCQVEAFQFYMSLIESNIMSSRIREEFSTFFDSFRLSEINSDEVKAQVTVLIKEWLDTEVPQLPKKPKLEDLEAWYDRLFPLVLADDLALTR